MADVLEAVTELLLLLCRVVYYWLEAIVMVFVPTSVIAKDISGQTVLITGAGGCLHRLMGGKGHTGRQADL